MGGDFALLELLQNVDPSIVDREEEAKLAELEVFGVVGEGDLEDIELQDAIMGEAELIEGDDGPPIGSDLLTWIATANS